MSPRSIICIAYIHLSLSDDPKRLGHPEGFILQVEENGIDAEAGCLLALTGDIVTMLGLPRGLAAYGIVLDSR